MKKAIIVLIFISLCLSVWAQCPENITFTSQTSIDNFSTDYPGCTQLSGSVTIYENANTPITSLGGLSQITSIGGNLTLFRNDLLENLSGLDNLTSVGGNIDIVYQDALNDISGLSNLTYIGGYLKFNNIGLPNLSGLDNLTSLTNLHIENSYVGSLSGLEGLTFLGNLYLKRASLGSLSALSNITSIPNSVYIRNINALTLEGLDNITTIGGSLTISFNDRLGNLSGLGNLTSIGGNLSITDNDDLTDVYALSNLTTIAGQVNIARNIELTGLNGLDNIDYTTITDLRIVNNSILAFCHVQSICDYIANGGTTTAFGNDVSCSFSACTSAPTCPVGDITFNSQQAIDNFSINYPDCTEITGWVFIKDALVTNINGLSQITSIGGGLYIYETNLYNVEGLQNIAYIGDGLTVSNNDSLSSLAGLNNLNTIGGELKVRDNGNLPNLEGFNNLTQVSGGIDIAGNGILASLDALSNLTSMNGLLRIVGNSALTTLAGLDNIIQGITYIQMNGNSNLSTCSVQSICDHLEAGGFSGIYNNAPGCDSEAEIEAACTPPPTCPQGNIALATQEDIDDFALNYPDCTEISGDLRIGSPIVTSNITSLEGLSNITYVASYLEVRYSDGLTSLAGLENISVVGGNIRIEENGSLTSLTGLEGLSVLGGSLNIEENNALISLEGLESLSTMGSSVNIKDNSGLISLKGLEGLTQIERSVDIRNNDNLTSLSGLENLSSVQERLIINDNYALVSIEALANLNTIGGNLSITNNNALTTLTGLENVTSIGENLSITNNNNLSLCDVLPVCDYIINGGNGTLTISGNAPSCINLNEVQAACMSLIVCPDNISLPSQADIDNFPTDYPGCTEIPGNVLIWFDTVDNLDGLSQITSIGGNLDIEAFDLFPVTFDMSGLQNLTTVGGDVEVWGDNIWQNPSLEGLQNLTTIGGSLELSYNGFPDLLPLQNLTSVGGWMDINNEYYITSLEGLGNVDYDNIIEFRLYDNVNLSICNYPSICSYFYNGGTTLIYNNAPGCDSQAEIELLCTSPCTGTGETSTDSLSHIFDEDLFIDGIGFANNPTVTFTDPATPANAVLSDISLELYFRLNGSSCENEIAIQITDPAGNTQPLTAYTSCDGGTGLFYVNLDVPSGSTTGSVADWIVEFDDTNDQNSDYEYSVRFARLNYVATTGGGSGETVVNEVSEIADMDLFIDGVGFENNGTYTFADPGTPADAVLSDISLELYFRLNGNSCENEIALQLTDPAGNTQALTAYTTCDGGTGLFYVNLDVPSGNTTGSPADWVLQFDDSNDQNADYEYSVRFGRLTYTTTYTEEPSVPVLITEEVVRTADIDLFIDGVGFENNPIYNFVDYDTHPVAELSNIQLELYFRLNGASCENEIALQVTDPADNIYHLTAYMTCDGGTGLYYVNLELPSGSFEHGLAPNWIVRFDDTNDQNSDYEYSVRFGRLTYTTQYDLCETQMMIVEENDEQQQLNNSSTRQSVNTSTRQLHNSLKLYPVPASQHLNVEYFSENANSTNIEVLSNEGKMLMQQEEFLQEGINTIKLDIADLPAGHYHIRMYNADDMQMQSFVKIAP